MKKLKVLLTGSMALAMMMPMVMTGVSAAESNPTNTGYNSKTDVSFDDSNIIPDPENPTDAAWGVEIPTTVRLNKGTTTYDTGIDVSVSMVKMPDGLDITDEEVRVYVASTNAYKLIDTKNGTTKTPLDYEIQYVASQEKTNAVQIVNNLKVPTAKQLTHVATFKNAATTEANATVEGKAYLKKAPTKKGDFKDTLTYVVVTADGGNFATPTNPSL